MNSTEGTPENTSTRDPLIHLVGLMGGSSRYITEMESAGQRQLLSSDKLPSEAPWDRLTELGFVPGDVVPGDSMFRSCTLPEGWRREASDDAMLSYIVDERGVRRVSVFYKAAFYDRSAHASISNVGYSLSAEAIYGDGAAELPDCWGVLTALERADFVDGLVNYIERAEESPTIYGDRVPRVEKLIAEATR